MRDHSGQKLQHQGGVLQTRRDKRNGNKKISDRWRGGYRNNRAAETKHQGSWLNWQGVLSKRLSLDVEGELGNKNTDWVYSWDQCTTSYQANLNLHTRGLVDPTCVLWQDSSNLTTLNKVLKTIPENVDTTKRKKRKEQIKICKFCERKAVQHEEQTKETRIKQEQLEDASIQASWQIIAITTLNGPSALVWKDKI